MTSSYRVILAVVPGSDGFRSGFSEPADPVLMPRLWIRFSLLSGSRVFRRRRRPRGALARLLSGVTETCQSWLDQKVFGGVFGTRQNQDLDWTQSGQAGPTLLDESLWSDLSGAELNDGCSFTYGGCPVRTRFSWVHQGPVYIISFLLQIPLKSRLLPTKKLRLQRRSYRRRFAQRSANQRSRWAGSLKSRLLRLSTPTAAAARRHLSPQVSCRDTVHDGKSCFI